MKYGIGVIGTHVWGCHSLERELVLTRRAEIRAIAAGDQYGAGIYTDESELRKIAEQDAAELGAEFVSDWHDIVRRPDITIVCVMACPKIKAKIIAEALCNDKYVVTDKPLAMTIAEARYLLEVESKSRARCVIRGGYHLRPGVRRLIEVVRVGQLGQIRNIHIRLHFMGGIFPGFVPTRRWRSEIPSGELTTIGAHSILTALKIMPDQTKTVYSVLKNDFYPSYVDAGAEDYALIHMQTESGAIICITVGRIPHRVPGEDIRIEVTGSRGFARAGGAFVELWPGETCERFSGDMAKIERDAFTAMFYDVIEKNGEPPVSLAEGVRLQEILAAAIASAGRQSSMIVG